MGRLGYTLLIGSLIAVVAITHFEPSWLGDENEFMRQFVDEQMLNILGVIIAIFLPSAATLYLRLAEIQRDRGVDLAKYRAAIRWNCGIVVGLFAATVVLLIFKGSVSDVKELTSAANGLTLVVLLANLLVLVDLTIAMFDVGEASARWPRRVEGGDGDAKGGAGEGEAR
jgi:hypothetical protein